MGALMEEVMGNIMSKMLGPFCNQTVNLNTKSRSLFCPIPKVH